MRDIAELTENELTRSLTYAGFVLLAYELVKRLIVMPIKTFYSHTTFGEGLPFRSYEIDVLSRHKNEFEACLLYLRDFMQALDSDDVLAIQGLRKHRNDLAHDLVDRLTDLDLSDYRPLLDNAEKALFKLSNYRIYMEIGSDPEFRDIGINWETVKGPEYLILEEIVKKVRILQEEQ